MRTDIVIEQVGKNCLLHSRTDSGRKWIETRFPMNQWRRILGWTVAVEDLREIRDILEAAAADGISLENLDTAVYDS